VGTLSLAGLNIAFPIQMLVVAIATMVGIGAASLISRYLGAKQFAKAETVFGNAILLVIAIAAVFTVLGSIFIESLLVMFGATEAILPYALEYMRIIFYSTVVFSMTVSMNNIIRAEGNAIMAMIVMMTGTLLNIPLDYLLVVVLGKGVAGAAMATVSAQLMGFIIISIYFISGKSFFKLKKRLFRPRLSAAADILAIGFPSLMRTGAMTLFAIVVNNAIKKFGVDAHFAIMGVVAPMVSFVMMPSVGISQGMQPIVGYNYGAGKFPRAADAFKKSIISATMISLLGFGVITVFMRPIVGAFIQQDNVVDMGVRILRITLLGIPTLGFQVAAGGYLQSVGKAGAALIVTSSRQVIFLIPLILILSPIYGTAGIWWSMPIADYASFILAAVWIWSDIRKERSRFLSLRAIKI